MHITRLFLNTWPPVPDVELKCDERVNVLIGPNASGKSTILRVIEYAYSPQKDHPLSWMYLPDSTWEDEVLRDEPEEWNIAWVVASSDWPRNDPPPIDGVRAYREPIWSKVPLLYVPATRVNLPLQDKPGDNELKVNLSEPSFPRSYGLSDADPTVFNGQHVRQVADKLRQSYASRLEERDQVDRVLDVGFSCAKGICPEIIHDYGLHTYMDRAGVGHPGMGIGTTDQGGRSLHIRDLSSGTQGTLLWIRALCLKMAHHYGWKDGWENEPAILLIDEIENHLHPSWQRRVIPALLKCFPGLQIFATTHSPFVVAGLKAGRVHLLSRNDRGRAVASTSEQDIVGWTADEILRTFMEVEDPTDELTANNAERLRELRRKDALEGLDDHEQAELEDLRTKAGADILARGGMLNAQRERFADMVQDFLKARLADEPRDEA